jgi:hypothetical protein
MEKWTSHGRYEALEPDEQTGGDIDRVRRHDGHEVDLLPRVELPLVRQLDAPECRRGRHQQEPLQIVEPPGPTLPDVVEVKPEIAPVPHDHQRRENGKGDAGETVQPGHHLTERAVGMRVVHEDEDDRREVADLERNGNRPVEMALRGAESEDLVGAGVPVGAPRRCRLNNVTSEQRHVAPLDVKGTTRP